MLLLKTNEEIENKIRAIAAFVQPRKGAITAVAEKAFTLLIEQYDNGEPFKLKEPHKISLLETGTLKRKSGVNPIETTKCFGCGKEHPNTYGLTQVWQIPGDKSSRVLLCSSCLENPEYNPQGEAL